MTLEQELLQGCKRNEPKAQTAFYDLYKKKLMGVCMRYAKSRDEAEDIFQDAFVRIFKSFDSLQNEQSLNYWVKQIVVRTAINYYHAQLKHNQNLGYETVLETSNQDFTNTIANISAQELMRYVNELADGYRIVFNMYVMDGYNHREIGEILGISENTSKSQLARAKEILRQKLEKVGILGYKTN